MQRLERRRITFIILIPIMVSMVAHCGGRQLHCLRFGPKLGLLSVCFCTCSCVHMGFLWVFMILGFLPNSKNSVQVTLCS